MKGPAVDPGAVYAEMFAAGYFDRVLKTDEERSSATRIAEQDADHERAEKKAQADHRRRIEIISLIAVLVTALIVCPVCLWVLADPSVSADKKAWASPTLTLIVGGLFGYLTGQVPGRMSQK